MTFKEHYVTEGLKDKIKGAFLASLLAVSTAFGSVNPNDLYQQIVKHEGLHYQVYKDTKNNLTIGIGFNLNDPSNRAVLTKLGISFDDLVKGRKLTPVEVKALYNVSITQAWNDAKTFLPNLQSYPDGVQSVVIDMAFNMGVDKLKRFTAFKAALLKHDYKTAAKEMLNSVWAREVKGRATELAATMAAQ